MVLSSSVSKSHAGSLQPTSMGAVFLGDGCLTASARAIFLLLGEKSCSEFLGIHVSTVAFYSPSAHTHVYNPSNLENLGSVLYTLRC